MQTRAELPAGIAIGLWARDSNRFAPAITVDRPYWDEFNRFWVPCRTYTQSIVIGDVFHESTSRSHRHPVEHDVRLTNKFKWSCQRLVHDFKNVIYDEATSAHSVAEARLSLNVFTPLKLHDGIAE